METDERSQSLGSSQHEEEDSSTTQGLYPCFSSEELQNNFQSTFKIALNIKKQADANHGQLSSILQKVEERCSRLEKFITEKVDELEQKINKYRLQFYDSSNDVTKKLKELKDKYNSLSDKLNKFNDESNKINDIKEESVKTLRSLEELSLKFDYHKSISEVEKLAEAQVVRPFGIDDLHERINLIQSYVDSLHTKCQQEIDKIINEQKFTKEQMQEINTKYDYSSNKLQEIEKIVKEYYQQEYQQNKNEIDKLLKSITNIHAQQENLKKNGDICKANCETNSIKVEELNENFNQFQPQLQNFNEQLLQFKKQQEENIPELRLNEQYASEIGNVKKKLENLLTFNKEANLKLSHYIQFLRPFLNKIDESWSESLATHLITASKNGQTYLVSLYMDLGANVNARELDKTPLHYAASNGYHTIVRILIGQKAIIDSKDNYCNSPLHCAAENGHLPVVIDLINNKANKDGKNIFNETPFHKAAEKGHAMVIAELIKRGAVINCKNNGDKTPLHYAAENGHLAVTKVLINHGINTSAKTKDGKTALDLAKMKEHFEVVKVLQEHRTL